MQKKPTLEGQAQIRVKSAMKGEEEEPGCKKSKSLKINNNNGMRRGILYLRRA